MPAWILIWFDGLRLFYEQVLYTVNDVQKNCWLLHFTSLRGMCSPRCVFLFRSRFSVLLSWIFCDRINYACWLSFSRRETFFLQLETHGHGCRCCDFLFIYLYFSVAGKRKHSAEWFTSGVGDVVDFFSEERHQIANTKRVGWRDEVPKKIFDMEKNRQFRKYKTYKKLTCMYVNSHVKTEMSRGFPLENLRK